MIVLHDSPSTDLSHIQALADIAEGFALFDYVRIKQRGVPTVAVAPAKQPAKPNPQQRLPLGQPNGAASGERESQADDTGSSGSDDQVWIAQIVQPNQNISTVGGRLDPTILHGLRLMQQTDNVQSVQSVQIFDLLILGQYDGGQLLTPRLRPLPGAVVEQLTADEVSRV